MHGGDIYSTKITYDFSVNTNPLGMPKEVRDFLKSDEAIFYAQVYPEEGSRTLRRSLSEKWDVTAEQVVSGNGVSELLHALFGANKPGKVLLANPCFTEYEKIAKLYGHQIISYDTKKESGYQVQEDILSLIEKEKPEIIMLCNPGNPIGNMIPKQILDDIVKLAEDNKMTLAIDECFLPFVCKDALSAICQYRDSFEKGRLIVFRSFTKIYAMAGLRVGYMVSSDIKLARDIKEKLPTWNVSSIAQQAAMLALSCDAYVDETRKAIAFLRYELQTALEELGLSVIGGVANYITFLAPKGLKDFLLKQGILIRECDDYKGLACDNKMSYYRIAVSSPEMQIRLVDALSEVD